MTSSNGSKASVSPFEKDREAYEVANQAREHAIRALLDAAEEIRAIGDSNDDATARYHLARSLEQSANYLNSRPADHIDDLSVEDEEMPAWGWMLLIFIIGLFVGRFMKKSE